MIHTVGSSLRTYSEISFFLAFKVLLWAKTEHIIHRGKDLLIKSK